MDFKKIQTNLPKDSDRFSKSSYKLKKKKSDKFAKNIDKLEKRR